ncbi:hypothetical protein AQUCO_05400074v1 [Aquilegia coerulea]|uniref:Chalcone isomerase domain-containing protein n=1 Tax=Aquilegia coerulea TaxID=218851 RepID=A0A2G5CHG0_AQUCA|nr:hypothetical protein AQUCO_05400074v1 [Aquilegia coerulea]PIA30717.1 hypothetical protein AQUCO_05400074v1 [Aquilegia coerulea]PIA30718.1 hypothetical protein AQUCO_05400074v1 [Aquilegia coerulea]
MKPTRICISSNTLNLTSSTHNNNIFLPFLSILDLESNQTLKKMVSLRFPFLFSQPSKLPQNPHNGSSSSSSRSFSTIAMAGSIAAIAGVGIGIGVSISHKNTNKKDPFLQNALDFFLSHHNSSLPLWGSLSLADTSSENVVETKTGTSFPTILNDTQRLLGIGLRKKSVFGLKNIDVYAFGVYADDSDVKKVLGEKYGKFSVSELKENKEFHEDIMDKDISMTVRLQIVYGRLSIRSVRSSFEESIGSRLQKLGGTDSKEVLQRFTSFLKDEIKVPSGSVIDLSREHGHILRTTINGKDVGNIQSKLLCRAVLDLYIGEDPFDAQAKEDTELNLASLVQK